VHHTNTLADTRVERLNSGSSVRLLRSVFVGLTAGGSACDSLHKRYSDGYRQRPHAHACTRFYVREIFLSVSPTNNEYKILLFKKNHRLNIYIFSTLYHPVIERGQSKLWVFVYSYVFFFSKCAAGDHCTWIKFLYTTRVGPKSMGDIYRPVGC
jgi:hypothetical protein